MAFKIKNGALNFPQSGEQVYVYHTGTNQLVEGLTTPDSDALPLDNPFIISDDDWWGFELPEDIAVDIWWKSQSRYLVQDINPCDITKLENPFPEFILKDGGETDPVFTAWDKSTGISITKSQITDINDYQPQLINETNIKSINTESLLGSGNITVEVQNGVETDPIFTAWDKSTGITITKSQITDINDYQLDLISGTNIKTINGESVLGSGNLYIGIEETDPVFTAWDKSTGITITESQVNDFLTYQEELVSGTNIKTIFGESVLGSGTIQINPNETDPIFSAWDKSTGITITESQISDFTNYQEELVSGVNIKTINGQSLVGSGDILIDASQYQETDPVFSAWDKSTGISITESQITDFGNYNEPLVSGSNIKTINGQSLLGSGTLNVSPDEFGETDPIFSAWDRSTGISITESQITDLKNYQDLLVSETNIKSVNGQSLIGSGDITIPLDENLGGEIITLINEELNNETWTSSDDGISRIGDIIGTFANVDTTYLECDHSIHLTKDYPILAPMLEIAEYGEATAWSWGGNNAGQLGLGDVTDRSTPTQIGSLSDWKNISCDLYSSLATKIDGSLWAWGYNEHGQLGLGDVTDRSSPVQVGSLTDWDKVYCGAQSALAIKTNGTLWSWGYNYWGELGINSTTIRTSPVQVGSLTDWNNISCGNFYCLATKTDGTLWSWGNNNFGQLGLGNTTPKSSPVQVGSLTNWNSISSYIHSLATKTDGTLWSWGYNEYGQLGLGDINNRSAPTQIGTDTDWSIVYSGIYHSLAIKIDGTLWSWGRNSWGQLGLGDVTDRSSPVQVGTDSDWEAVGGGNFTIAKKTDGTLWSWGAAASGALGLGDIINKSNPVQIGNLNGWNKITGGGNSVIALYGDPTPISFYTPNLPPIDGETYYIKAK